MPRRGSDQYSITLIYAADTLIVPVLRHKGATNTKIS
jgi:hypothetical protein